MAEVVVERRDAFAGEDSLEPRRIGSFIRMDNRYFRLWCDDEVLRHRALLDLAEVYLSLGYRVLQLLIVAAVTAIGLYLVRERRGS